MKRSAFVMCVAIATVLMAAVPAAGSVGRARVSIGVSWGRVVRVSRTVPTTQYLGSAWSLRSNPHNTLLLRDLRNLHTNDTRVQLWYPLVRQAVAELKPPTRTRTLWDFRYMDQTVVDF